MKVTVRREAASRDRGDQMEGELLELQVRPQHKAGLSRHSQKGLLEGKVFRRGEA
jgi:hypothetical protein